jgi:hypothetical protein
MEPKKRERKEMEKITNHHSHTLMAIFENPQPRP